MQLFGVACTFCALLLSAKGTAGLVALITPASGSIPLGKTDAAYTCLYGVGGQFQQWLVTVPSLVIQLALVPNGGLIIADLLRRYGITMAPGKPDVLLVNATLQSNDTSVVCTIVVNGTAVNSDTVVITVFGRPDPPVQVKSSVLGVGNLLLSWSPISNTNITYSLSVADPAAPVTVLFTFGPITEPQLAYKYPATGAWCTRYLFTVMAMNEAGDSDPSQPVIASAPTVPQFFEVPTSLVVLTLENVTVYFLTKIARTCPDYPVQTYSIHIYDNKYMGVDVLISGLYTFTENNSSVEFVVQPSYGLKVNARYYFVITALNEVGNSSTSTQIAYTTDVQSSTITGRDHQLNVTCFFAEGTQARGCAVCLEKSGEVVYQMVPRVNEIAKGGIRTEFSVDCYNISVVDWEEDGSIGSLGIPVNVTYEQSDGCTSGTGGDVSMSMNTVPLLVVASSATVGGSMIVAMLLAVVVVISFARFRRREVRLHEKWTSPRR